MRSAQLLSLLDPKNKALSLQSFDESTILHATSLRVARQVTTVLIMGHNPLPPNGCLPDDVRIQALAHNNDNNTSHCLALTHHGFRGEEDDDNLNDDDESILSASNLETSINAMGDESELDDDDVALHGVGSQPTSLDDSNEESTEDYDLEGDPTF